MSSDQEFEAVAIVGMAGRFPKASSVEEYWDNLVAGRECLTEFSEDEIVSSGVDPDSLLESRRRTRGVLDGAFDFDARFFGFSPREAEIMDPQQRIFLEVAWEALEDAGYDSERPPGPIGIWAGSGINTYFAANVATRPDVLGPFGKFGAVVLNEKDFIATRVAYAMDLHGPALTVQTACSTSLVAVCYAAQSLLNYDCDLAIAGSSAAVVPQTHSSIHEEGGMISPDGRCRPFDAHASGTLFSDGAGAVVLRRLSDAIEDGDQVRAVIRGFAVNNDGSGKAGYTAPSVDGQAEVIEMAQEIAGVSPDTISYIEAHGTATPLGDPIEIAALTQAFAKGTSRTGFCGIGSVKSNIGHLDVSAGIAGVIKTTLALQHRQIPPTINFETPNPRVDWASTPFHVIDRLTEWPDGPTPRRAGVSSFGIGGTNAHVILEEAPLSSQTTEEEERPQVIVVSARTPPALDDATANLAAHIRSTDHDLADVAATLQLGRRQFLHRRAVVAASRDEVVRLLDDPGDRRVITASTRHRQRPVAFMFSGQGSQYEGMARGLYDGEPVFREAVDRCAAILEPILSQDIRALMYPEESLRDLAADELRQTANTQPALFVIEYALASLWQSWGVRPSALAGHSIGEYVAACLSGVFSLEDALRLVAARGRLMQSLPPGSMLAVPLAEEDLLPLLDDRTCIGVINSEGMCVVSGEIDAVARLAATLEEKGLQTRPVPTSHAFHSPMMEPILDDFRAEIAAASPGEPRIPLLSNRTGTWMTAAQAVDADYWAEHLRHTVRFHDCLSTLLAEPDLVLLEVGPGRTLASLTRMHPGKSPDTVVVSSTRHPEEDRPDHEFALEALGQLWVSGVEVDWKALHDGGRRKVSLPTYPFQRERYYLEPGRPAAERAQFTAVSPAATSPNGESVAETAREPETVSPRETHPRTDDVEQTIARIWEELLGVSGIRPDDNFFELGGTSLAAARMFALITERCGRRLPLSTLVTASTISALAAEVREGSEEASSIVEVQAGDGSKPPLFLIHAEGGHVLMYRDLAMGLGPEWTVYGIQSRGLDGTTQPSDSVEEMAGRYLADMRKIQPEGPYYLGGWCLGGTIGYEMAKLLQAEGEEVAWLGMIQARHTNYWKSRDQAMSLRRLGWRTADRIAYETDNLSELRGQARVRYVSEKARRVVMRSWARVEVDGPRHSYVTELAASAACDRAHLAAYWAYDPQPYDGKVTIIYSSNQPHGIDPDPTLGWGPLLLGEVDLYEVPSHHGNIIHGERIGLVAEIMRSTIESARTTPKAAPVPAT